MATSSTGSRAGSDDAFGHGTGRGCEVPATERGRSAADQRRSTPSVCVGWSRYVRPSSFVAGRITRPAKGFAGRVVRTSLRGPDVSRPLGNGSARVSFQRRRGVVSKRPTELLRRGRPTRPARRSAGRVAAAASASELGGAYRDQSAADQRESASSDGVEWSRYVRPSSFVAGRPTRPARRAGGRVAAAASASELGGAYRDQSAGDQRESASSDGVEWSRYVRPSSFVAGRPTRPAKPAGGRAAEFLRRIETSRQGLSAGRPPAGAQSGLDTSDRAPSSPVGLLDQRRVRRLLDQRSGVSRCRRGRGCRSCRPRRRGRGCGG